MRPAAAPPPPQVVQIIRNGRFINVPPPLSPSPPSRLYLHLHLHLNTCSYVEVNHDSCVPEREYRVQ